jgi:hypothetical protein
MSLMDIIFGAPAMLYDKETEQYKVLLGPISGEDESYSANVCSHAIENGSEVSDHVYSQPGSFTIKTFLADKNDLVSMAAGAVFGNQTVSQKIALLKLWQNTGELLVYSGPVFSGLKFNGYDMYIEDVVITSLRISRNIDNGEGLDVSISLKKIIIADAFTTDIRLPQAARSASHTGLSSTGTASAVGKPSSILNRAFKG